MTANTNVDNMKKNAILKMLPVQVHGPKGILNIVAFIDDGSNYAITGQLASVDDRSEKVPINIPTFTMTYISRTMENLNLLVQKFDVTNLSVKYPYIDQAEKIGLIGVRPLLFVGQDRGRLAPQILVGFFFKGPLKKQQKC
jgi:hypothetical protein